jgi:sirohydrochlorin ferrochelatase
MKALLLVAHGSQRKQSNDEVVVLAEKLRKNLSHHYGIVNAAFLEAADVLLPEGIQQCVNEGATAIVVLPYFLNSGKHIVEDIPAIVNSCKSRYPDIEITIAPHIGASPLMIDIILASVDTAKTG